MAAPVLGAGRATAGPVFKLDASQAPEFGKWAEESLELAKEWYPRIANLLLSQDYRPPESITLRIRRSETGVGSTSGSVITIHSSWIEKHPDDFGLVIHELTHVVQGYQSKRPVWLTEGIADYVRWAIYEGRQLNEFPSPQGPNGFTKGYQTAAGFLLWLDSHRSPGAIRRLNTFMRKGEPAVMSDHAGGAVSWADLWREYQKFRRPGPAD